MFLFGKLHFPQKECYNGDIIGIQQTDKKNMDTRIKQTQLWNTK